MASHEQQEKDEAIHRNWNGESKDKKNVGGCQGALTRKSQMLYLISPFCLDLIFASMDFISECFALAAFKWNTWHQAGYMDKNTCMHMDIKDMQHMDARAQCYYFLNTTSRSFAAVVQALHVELRDAICVFYLVLRGLDTIEDDMTIPLDTKMPLLSSFHEKLYQQGWTFDGNHEKEKDRILLQHFNVVVTQFSRLRQPYQHVIADICKQMGKGMADFAAVRKVNTKQDWNLYCHYVAGLVGIGLCRLFARSGLEDERIANVEPLANSMGLFLQKVNIIRDYFEDLRDGRTFWPEEIWSKYAVHLDDFAQQPSSLNARDCLNELIADALTLIPDCLQFMSMLQEPSVFCFCAIPQVMAIATLALCFDNERVFQENVKIRKGLAVKLIMQATDMTSVVRIFLRFSRDIAKRIDPQRMHALTLSKALSQVDAWAHCASQNTAACFESEE